MACLLNLCGNVHWRSCPKTPDAAFLFFGACRGGSLVAPSAYILDHNTICGPRYYFLLGCVLSMFWDGVDALTCICRETPWTGWKDRGFGWLFLKRRSENWWFSRHSIIKTESLHCIRAIRIRMFGSFAIFLASIGKQLRRLWTWIGWLFPCRLRLTLCVCGIGTLTFRSMPFNILQKHFNPRISIFIALCTQDMTNKRRRIFLLWFQNKKRMTVLIVGVIINPRRWVALGVLRLFANLGVRNFDGTHMSTSWRFEVPKFRAMQDKIPGFPPAKILSSLSQIAFFSGLSVRTA